MNETSRFPTELSATELSVCTGVRRGEAATAKRCSAQAMSAGTTAPGYG